MSLLTWLGNVDHQASNPANWSPNGAPQSGDALLMSTGVMHIGSQDLAGDTLTVSLIGPNPSQGGSAELDLASAAVVPLTAHINGGMLHTIGGTLQFIDSSDFSAYSTVFNSNLSGSGTLAITGSNHHGETMEVNGTVGADLTFIVNRGGAPDATLQIDRPADFQATIDLSAMTTNDFIGLGHIGLIGAHATGGTFSNGTLTLTDEDGATVDTLRIKGGTGLQAWQSNTGVMLTAGRFNDIGAQGMQVTPIPLGNGA
jgi:hypothetical protein